MTDVPPPIYLDNHATTRVDPRVVDVMLPLLTEQYGNAGSTSHIFGWHARDVVDAARRSIAKRLGAHHREILFTSGATESNNLALRGVCLRRGNERRHVVSVATEHKAVLDPLATLEKHGFEITLLPVATDGSLDIQQLSDALRDDTAIVSVMLANNEVGVIHPIEQISQICEGRGVLLHCDATQAVGRIPVNMQSIGADLVSFSAHKIYGPKGIGVLYVRRRRPTIRLESQMDGGGQEKGLRSGTLNVAGIAAIAKAVELCVDELPAESQRQQQLRNRLFERLSSEITGVQLNGPPLKECDGNDILARLPNNLNCQFAYVDGEALMMSMSGLAVSSGSACTSANPEPSHVLRAMGLSADETKSSLRFGLGRFNTSDEVERAVDTVVEAVERLRGMSSLA